MIVNYKSHHCYNIVFIKIRSLKFFFYKKIDNEVYKA